MSKLELYPYQEKGLELTLENPQFPLFMEMGTGKTPIAIKSIEERYKAGEVNRVLLFVPNTITYNWKLEIQKFLDLPKEQYIIERLREKRKKKRLEQFETFTKHDLELSTLKELKARGYKGRKKDILKANKPKLLILLLNYAKARVMLKELKRYKAHMLIIDESHKLKNRGAQVSRNVYKLARNIPYRILMTGTPITNGYEDIFMQYKILDDEILGKSWGEFERRYIIKGGYMGYQIVGYRNEDELSQIIADTSYRVKLEDCTHLPEVTTRYLTCELNSKARKAYNEMNEEMLTQLDKTSEEIPRKELKEVCRKQGIYYHPQESYLSLLTKASEYIKTSSCELAITKILRLQQIAGGFLTMDSGEIIYLGSDKLKVVQEEVLEASKPIIIFCQYVPEINLLVEELSNIKRQGKKLSVESYRDVKNREQIYRDFQKGEVDVLILQLSSGSVGLNLQAANRLIFYSWNFSSDDYVQAIARIRRRGQKNSMLIDHIIAEDTIDLEILEVIKHKRKLADWILDQEE